MDDLISRKAAIDALQDRYKLYSWDDGGAQKAEIGAIIREIYDMPPAQPDPDTISRKQAIEPFMDNSDDWVSYDVRKILESLPPSPTPSRPQGRWLPTDNESFKQCSECGRHVYAYKYPSKVYPYCHCGADMRGDAECEK